MAPLRHALRIDAIEYVSHRTAWLALALIIVTGAILRFYFIQSLYLSPDEGWHIYLADHSSLREVIRHAYAEDAHPPLSRILFFLFLHISHSVTLIRMVPLFFGLALIPVWFVIGRYLACNALALIFAFFMAIWEGPLLQSIVIREYTMMLFFISIALYAAMRFWDEPNKWKPWFLLYMSATLLGLFTLYSAAFVTFATGATIGLGLLVRKDFRTLVLWGFSHLLLALLLIASVKQHQWLQEDWNIDFYDTKLIPLSFFMLIPYATGWLYISGFLFWIFGLDWLIKKSKKLALYFLVLWATAIGLHVAGYYAFNPSRHSLYLIIAILPCIAYSFYCMTGWVAKNSDRWKYTLHAWAVLVFICGLASIPFYPGFDDPNEFVPNKKAYHSLVDHLSQNSGKNEIFIMDKQSFFILRMHESWKEIAQVEGTLRQAEFLSHAVFYQNWNALTLHTKDKQTFGGMIMNSASLHNLLSQAVEKLPPKDNLYYKWVYLGFQGNKDREKLDISSVCLQYITDQNWVEYSDQSLNWREAPAFVVAIPSQQAQKTADICK